MLALKLRDVFTRVDVETPWYELTCRSLIRTDVLTYPSLL